MGENISQVKKDLGLILHLNSKLDYSNTNQVQDVHNGALQKQLFQSSLGQKFITKLEYILMGSDDRSCIFCGKPSDNPGIICSSCLAKYQPKDEASPTSKLDTIPKEEPIQEIELSQDIEHSASDDFVIPDMETISEQPDELAIDTLSDQPDEIELSLDEIPTDLIREKPKRRKKKKHKFKPNPKGFVIVGIVLAMIISLTFLIGIHILCAILLLLSIAFLIYASAKNGPKKFAGSLVILFLVATIATNVLYFILNRASDMLDYIGTSKEEVFEDYNPDNFYEEYKGLTNEKTVEKGKAALLLNNDKVSYVVLTGTTEPDVVLAGLHIGSPQKEIEGAMARLNAKYIEEYSIPNNLLCYRFNYKGKNMQIVIKLGAGMISGVTCGSDDIR